MCLLYADDSGSPRDPNQQYFLLAGVAVFERQVHWLGSELDRVVAPYDTTAKRPLELHGSPMLRGNDGWQSLSRPERVQVIKDALGVLAGSMQSTVAFGVAVRKGAIPGLDPVAWAFEELCRRFDDFLKQLYFDQQKRRRGHNHVSLDPQRGLMIFDDSTMETTLQGLVRQFRQTGHSTGLLRNIAEVPLFVDSRATRLVQLADLVAYSVFRHVEHRDSQFLDVIRHRLHHVGTQEHGLLIKHT